MALAPLSVAATAVTAGGGGAGAGGRGGDGATAVVARLPQGLGFGPSVLDAQGVEERGSFTLHKSNPYAETSIRVYGKMNHPIKCTLKSYRKLGGMFRGQTVYTGYKKIWLFFIDQIN